MATAATTASIPIRTIAPDEGELIWFNAALVNLKQDRDWSEGRFVFAEITLPRGRATGLHTDPSDETFYVLDGEILFHLDGDEHRAGRGTTVSIRRGVPHAFVAVSETARFLYFNTPGTHDRLFREGGVPAATRDFADTPPPDHERTVAAADAVGSVFLGPPPFPEELVVHTSG
jgi:mannose-6-phosphate isomerase-like protein (cupin superfamily)